MLKIAHIGKLHTNTYRVELHNHNLWEAVYYTKGKGKLQVGEETVSFQAGDIFILPPGLIHSDYSDGGFQDIFFTFYRTNLPANRYHRFRDLDTEAILHLLNQMHDAFMRNNPNREAIINLLYELIFQYMYTWDSSPKMNTYVESIRNAVIAGFSDPYFSITDVIKNLHLNANYARDLFVKWTGSTPAHFLLEKRMEYAKQLLFSRHLSNYSIQQISFMCGFSDPYYFSRMFRKHTGLSPREWEKQLPHSSNP